MSKNSRLGGRAQASFGTAWSADGYASAGKSNGSYQGVGQQSGLFAGDGGYHVDAGHVNLVGGAIASTNATNSELTAQTLTFSDLQNQMQLSTSSGGISGGYGGRAENWKPTTDGATPNFGGGVPMNEKGGDSSTTYATLTEGNIVIGGKKVTAAELGVNTDAATAHRAIEAMPNAELQLANQQAMANAMGTVVATSKQIANDVQAYKANKAVEAYFADLTPQEKANFNAMDAAARDAVLTRDSQAYRDSKQWGIGGDNSRALEAVTTLLVGATSGQGGGQMVTNALAPYAANLIGDKFDTNHGSDPNAALQLLSHALLGALLAEANGGNAASGAGAAAGGELAAKFLTDHLYGGEISKLNDEERQNILALSQAVGALAGGLAVEGISSAALGANLAKNSVENNWLSKPEIALMEHERAACDAAGGNVQACKDGVTSAYDELNAGRDRELLAYAKEVELSMRQYPAVSEQDYKDEWSARMDLYWQQYPGIPVDDRVPGRTPGADFAYGWRQLTNDMLVSGALNLSGIVSKGFDGWLMDKTVRDAEAMRSGVIAQWNLLTGIFTSTYPGIEIQGAFDQASVMTAKEESAAYLALLKRAADKGVGAVGTGWGIKGGNAKAPTPGRGTSMPVPEPTTASNGLVYQSNGKHSPGERGYNYNAGTEPGNSMDLFGSSVENGRKRYALDSNGEVHQFTNANDGTWHWAGSTSDKSAPLKKNDIPSEVKRAFGIKGKGWK